MGKISEYAVDGVPSLADKLIGTDTSSNDETKNYPIMDILSLGSAYFSPIGVGSFYDKTVQSIPSGDVGAMKCDTTSVSQYVTVELDGNSDPTQFTFLNAGVYNIQFSAQLHRASGGSDAITDIWLRVDGVDVPDSATRITMKSGTSYVVASWNWFVDVAAGSNAQIMWYHNDAIQLLYEAEDVVIPRPAIPSVIVTVNRVK
ncbi:MAG: hypothetical protein [Podoviridae sp. ctrTa16]|nr:MAG: hypothetical protein [Podoviridae sp. ctrTa16]